MALRWTLWSELAPLTVSAAVQHERGPRTSTIRKQVALYFRGHKEDNGAAAHFPSAALPAPAFFTAVTQLEPHGLELAAVSATPERQTLVSLAQPTPKVSGLAGPREGGSNARQRCPDFRDWTVTPGVTGELDSPIHPPLRNSLEDKLGW